VIIGMLISIFYFVFLIMFKGNLKLESQELETEKGVSNYSVVLKNIPRWDYGEDELKEYFKAFDNVKVVQVKMAKDYGDSVFNY
jgi:RNA recognition motif-containing protein